MQGQGRRDELKHGTNVIGPSKYGENTWFRRDTWIRKADGETIVERRFATGPDDISPLFVADYFGLNPDDANGKSDSRCSCCYLGFSHTLDHHNRAIAAADSLDK